MIDTTHRRLGRLLVALALLLGFLSLTPAATRAATLDVCPSGCNFSSIQVAINAAASGDTISISAGTYTESLLISKNLTLQGAGANQTTLKGGNFGGVVSTWPGGFTIDIDGVTITGGRDGSGISNQNNIMTVRNSIISGNSSSSSIAGGGISNIGTLTLQNSTVSGNSASGSAGGIFNNGTLTLQNSTVSGNTSASMGGGIVNNSGQLTLQNSTISGNSALNNSNAARAGGISNSGTVTLQDSTISANVANTNGGGIVNFAQRTVTIIRSTVSDNTSGSGNTTSSIYLGGGVYNEGTLIVTESTVSGNRSLNSSGNSAAGGISSSGTLNVTNSTISANTGGIITTGGTLNVTNSTITNNSASFGVGGVSFTGSVGTVQNTIIANNQSTSNCGGTRLSDNGGNLSSDGSCSWSAASSRNNTNPLLGVLADNGGPTQTHALLSGSPAIDAAIAACPATDQRGIARPQGNGCDSGAFEFGQTVSPTSTPTNTPTDVPTSTPTDVPTSTPTDVPTNTPTDVPTNTPTDVPTNTPTNTATSTPTNTPTNTPTDVPTSTPINTATSTPTDVPTSTPTSTPASAVDTTTSFTTSANPARLGEPITFRATVTAASGATPGGTVTFLSGTTALGTGTLVTGVASFTTSSLPVGNSVITARYEGTPVFNSSVSAAGTQVVRAGSSTTLTLSASTSMFGQTMTLTATVSGGTASPSGSVTFYDGATSLGTKALRSGAASLTVSTLAAGQHTLTAVYGGSPQIDSSVSPAVSYTVTPAQAIASLTVAPNPSVLGQTVTLTATVRVVAPGGGKPAGTVSFYDGTTLLGSKTLGANGVATYSTSTLAVGSHNLRAEYSGSTNHSASASAPSSVVVNTASTTTTLATTATNVVNGQKITLTATVAAVAPGKGTPAGSIIFRDGTTELGSVTLNNGRATKQVTLALGSHSLVAEYVPATDSFSASSGTASVSVSPASTSVTLTTSGTPSIYGRNVTFTATVKVSAPGVGTPTGTVIFRDGETVLAEVALVNGKAIYATTALASGTHPITATYSGDAGNTGSLSSTLTQQVN
jgi:large repetitive protein